MSLIGKSIGNYQIKAKLGEGGMGAVYLGEHPLIGKRVAVKVLLEELAAKEDIVARFFNEAKAVNDIGHQNIVDVVDFGKMPNANGGADVVYFIMEYLDGESLSQRLRSTGLNLNETLHVIAQCCSALAASHAKGIVHRDLKPENLYLCPRGGDKNFVKILDFGIAKLTGDGGTSSHKTRTGLVIGTPAYMSPEQCEGKGLIDHRSDIYSLGVVMYELLTGRVPFPGEGFGEILVAHLTKAPDPPSQHNPDIKPEIEALVMHAIEKDRNRRFQSMDEFAQAVANPAAHLQSYSPLPGYTPAQVSSHGGGTMMLPDGAPPYPAMAQGGGPTTGVAPRPTTLSGAAAEVEGDLPKKSKGPLFAVMAAVVLLAAGGGFFALHKGETKPEVQPAVVQKPAVPQTIKLRVTSEPPGARVFRADTGAYADGTTPLTIEVKQGSPNFDIQLKLDGYKAMTKSLSTDHSDAVLVSLEKEPAPTPAVPPPTQPVVAEAKPEKDHHHHHSDRKPTATAQPTKPASSDTTPAKKPGKGDGADDMRLLTPKF